MQGSVLVLVVLDPDTKALDYLLQVSLFSPAVNSSLYTLHLTPYALHSTPYPLHPSPYTLHPTPYTLHPSPYTLHHTPCTILLAHARQSRPDSDPGVQV